MTEPLSIASGVAGIITLTSAVVAAGYKYLDAVRSAPQDIKDLMREITLLNTIVSQMATHSFLAEPGSYPSLAALNNQNIFKDCESTLLVVRQHLDRYEPTNKSRRKNALKTLSWPVGQKDIIKGRERIERLCNVLNTAMALDNASSLNRLEALQHLSLESTQTLLDVSCGLEEQKILDWLSVLTPKVKHTSTRQLQQPGTCDWLLREETIKQWTSEPGPDFVWLRGSSGSGKTVLISNVIEYLQHRIQACATLGAVAYHYCEFANPTTLDARQILSSILRQIVEQINDFPSVLRNTYQQHSHDVPSLEILRSLLHQIVKASFEPVYIIIDGIDECPNRQAIVQMVLELQSQPRASPRIKIMVSSRPEHDLQKAWVDRPHFSILPQHLQIPLEVHVQKELLKIPKLLRLDPIFQADLANGLVSRADGMFRWVQCQIDALRKARTSIALQRVLLSLPEGLFETYDRILERVDDIDQEYVLRALKWLVGSERPLSLEELAEAIAIDVSQALFDLNNRFIEPEEILELCGSLVSIRSDHKVVLAHFSVREYLTSCQLKERKPLAKFALDGVTSGQYISRCLLTYAYTVGLHIQDLDSTVLNGAQYPLLRYIYDSSASRFQDFIAMSLWTEAHFPAQAKNGYHRLKSIVQYAQPPAPYEENWEDAWAVKGVLQCALMCYWDGCLGHDRRGEIIVTGDSVSKEIGEMFVALQQEW
ncbi:hypothetical protein BKA63DRAFT_74120 [Paraphoma chrysanthemicola]|nr:hypothetical protein BKA63DRAFT_74120 [Paraphoma chrysanthemicola]